MAAPSQASHQVRFGEFRLDLQTAELCNNGQKVTLQDQPFHVLGILLEQPGRLVTRDELRKKLWPSGTFVDFDHSLNKAVNRLREALGDDAESPRFIETLPRRGYRFIAPVQRWPESSLPARFTKQRWPWTIAMLAVVVIVVVGLGVYRRLPPSRSLGLENMQITKLTDSGRAVHAGISPDGRYVAYAVRDGERQELCLRQLATRTEVQILPPDYGDFLGLTFSADSNYIYFVRSDKNDLTFRYLYSVPVLGGRVQKLITNVDSPVSFSANGREFVYQRFVPPHNDVELRIANADGSGQRVLAVIHHANFLAFGPGPGPTWSPDGRTIAVPIRLQSTPPHWVLDTVSVADGSIRELYSSSGKPGDFGRPVWLPNGNLLLVPHYDSASGRMQLWTVSFPGGLAHRLTNDLSDYDTGDLDITRDGRTVSAIAETGLYNIWVAPATDVSKAKQITYGELPMIWVAEVPEGKLLSVSWNFELWVMNPDGGQRAPFADIHPADWLEPCGRFVVFVGAIGGGSLMRADDDGTHVTELVNGNLVSPACSPDTKFAFYVNVEQPQKIWRVPVEGGTPVEIAKILGDSIVDRLSVSPDGRLLAYPYSQTTNTAAPGWNLAIVRVDGGPPVKTFKVSGGFRNPRWSPDGKGLQYLLTRDKATNIWEQPLEGGEPRQITRFTSGHMFDFRWSLDRTRLLMTRGDISSNVILQNFR